MRIKYLILQYNFKNGMSRSPRNCVYPRLRNIVTLVYATLRVIWGFREIGWNIRHKCLVDICNWI